MNFGLVSLDQSHTIEKNEDLFILWRNLSLVSRELVFYEGSSSQQSK